MISSQKAKSGFGIKSENRIDSRLRRTSITLFGIPHNTTLEKILVKSNQRIKNSFNRALTEKVSMIEICPAGSCKV
jgi:hypothetical protein